MLRKIIYSEPMIEEAKHEDRADLRGPLPCAWACSRRRRAC